MVAPSGLFHVPCVFGAVDEVVDVGLGDGLALGLVVGAGLALGLAVGAGLALAVGLGLTVGVGLVLAVGVGLAVVVQFLRHVVLADPPPPCPANAGTTPTNSADMTPPTITSLRTDIPLPTGDRHTSCALRCVR